MSVTSHNNTNLGQAELKQFRRALNTNYKYSTLVTLTLDLTRERKIHKMGNQIAKRYGIGSQKNYGIVCVRLALLVNQAQGRAGALRYIFGYLLENYEKCIEEKYLNSVGRSSRTLMQEIKDKCLSDIHVFKRIMESLPIDQIQMAELFLNLYREDPNQPATTKQLKEARKLARLAVGVSQSGENFIGTESLLQSNLGVTEFQGPTTENAFHSTLYSQAHENSNNSNQSEVVQEMIQEGNEKARAEADRRPIEEEAQSEEQTEALNSFELLFLVKTEKEPELKLVDLVDYTFYEPDSFEMLGSLDIYDVIETGHFIWF